MGPCHLYAAHTWAANNRSSCKGVPQVLSLCYHSLFWKYNTPPLRGLMAPSQYYADDLESATSASNILDRLISVEQEVYGKVGSRPTADVSNTLNIHIANTAPLGNFGFAIASILVGILKISSSSQAATDGQLFGTAVLLGGMAQVIAAVFQFLTNNSYGGTVFGVYGLHWVSQGLQMLFVSLGQYTFSERHPISSVTYSAAFAVVTFLFLLPTLRMNRILSLTMFALLFVFIFEIPAAFDVRAAEILSGVSQCLAGCFGLYLGALDLINESFQAHILPLFPHREHQNEYQKYVYVPKKTHYKSSMSQIHM